jgi:hydrogenase expression/formation protein HypC
MCLGIPGKVVALSTTNGLAMGTVEFGGAHEPDQAPGGGIRKQVCLAYVPEAAVGDYVIVHVGFAIAQVDQEEAQRTLGVLRAMAGAVEGELGEPLPAVGGPA